jgi:Cysteine-rich CPXCG
MGFTPFCQLQLFLRLHAGSAALGAFPFPLLVVDVPFELFHRNSALLTGHMEHFFSCPYCWQEISMVLDPAVKSQTYVEDCEVCCHPIQIRYSFEDGEVVSFEANILE